MGQHEIDLSIFEIDCRDLDPKPVAKPIDLTGALTGEPMTDGVEVVVIVVQRSDVHETIDVDTVKLNEQPKALHTGDGAVELVAELVSHELAFEPVLDVTRCLIGATFRP